MSGRPRTYQGLLGLNSEIGVLVRVSTLKGVPCGKVLRSLCSQQSTGHVVWLTRLL